MSEEVQWLSRESAGSSEDTTEIVEMGMQVKEEPKAGLSDAAPRPSGGVAVARCLCALVVRTITLPSVFCPSHGRCSARLVVSLVLHGDALKCETSIPGEVRSSETQSPLPGLANLP